jgi:hypothetical protein
MPKRFTELVEGSQISTGRLARLGILKPAQLSTYTVMLLSYTSRQS